MPWLRWLVAGLPLWRCGFCPSPVHMRFVVNKVALGQVFHSVIKFSPISIILPMLHPHVCLQADGIRKTGRQGLGTLKWISALPEIEGIGNNSTFFFFISYKFLIFILVINQLDAKNLFYNKFISCLYMFRAPCAHRQEIKIVLHSLWYHHTQ